MHPLHQQQMTGRFRVLNVPDPDVAPVAVAKRLAAYRKLADQYRAERSHARDLVGKLPEREADAADARAGAAGEQQNHRSQLDENRRASHLRVLSLQGQLDQALAALVDAVEQNRKAWAEVLNDQQREGQATISDALATIDTESERLDSLNHIATWVRTFPNRTTWASAVPPIPEDRLTAMSTLRRFLDGQITAHEIGITSYPGESRKPVEATLKGAEVVNA